MTPSERSLTCDKYSGAGVRMDMMTFGSPVSASFLSLCLPLPPSLCPEMEPISYLGRDPPALVWRARSGSQPSVFPLLDPEEAEAGPGPLAGWLCRHQNAPAGWPQSQVEGWRPAVASLPRVWGSGRTPQTSWPRNTSGNSMFISTCIYSL